MREREWTVFTDTGECAGGDLGVDTSVCWVYSEGSLVSVYQDGHGRLKRWEICHLGWLDDRN